ncbi:MAG TPA: isoprenylcysteine carboxylmethyltransferase family protein [Solirubrobacterales bacterium]
MSAWRHARAIVLLPGTASVVVPAIILLGGGSNIGWSLAGFASVLPVLLGIALISAGLLLWLWTVRLFARVGRGTLAPWDPTRRLVVEGPYRHVRNPMITAVIIVLGGEAALFGSPQLLIWLAVFFTVNHAYFLAFEEPDLERRFGEDYRTYRHHVPRWLPRRTPWPPSSPR